MVQLYVKDMLASVDVPNIKLMGFEKVLIGAGETVQVPIDVKVEDLWVWNSQGKYVVEPGNFTIYVGSGSGDLRGNATLTVS